MANTKKGGLKTAAVNRAKYGPDFYARIGRLGGLSDQGNLSKRGFGSNRELASKLGSLSGGHRRKGSKVNANS